jgi:signal transduction histidine kinase/DNA-binding response OmpR family regulator/ligand-binding sensor domain-containing protein
MNKTKPLLLFLLSLLCLTNVDAQNINFRYLGMNEGLSQMSVTSIWSDEMDVMWFTTRRGINYYDGTSILPLVKSSKDGHVEHFDRSRMLCGDKKGSIYFISDEELVQYNRRNNEFKSLGKNITSISHQQNKLWATRKQTILHFNKQTNLLEPYLKLKSVPKSHLEAVLESANGQLYVGSDNEFINIDKKKNERIIIPGICVTTLYEDNKRNIWIGTKDGLYKMTPDMQVSRYVNKKGDANSLLSNNIRAITQDKDGNLWIGTNFGINKFVPATENFTAYTPNENNSSSLSNPSVYSIFCDKQGTIWIGTFYGGVNFFNTQNEIFKYPFNEISRLRKSYVIDVICPINSEEFFITSSALGAFRYNIRTNKYVTIPIPFNSLHLLSCFYDKKSNLIYCGTNNNGVAIYDPTRNSFLPNKIDVSNSCLKSNNIVGLTVFDTTLYLATLKGYIAYDLKKHTSSPVFSQITDRLSSPSDMMIDSKGNLWMLFLGPEVVHYDFKKKKIKIHRELIANKPLEQSIRTNSIFEDKNHRIWIATSGKGLCKYNEKTAKFEIFANENSGLNSNYCFDINEGINGELVAFENNGITFVDVENRKFKHLPGERFLCGKIMNEGCGNYADNKGNILVGTIQGLVAFNHELLSKDAPKFNLFFSKLLVNSEEVLPNDGKEIIEKSLPYLTSLELNSKNKSFDIVFSITDYLKTGNFNTEYKLDGFDKQWIKTNSKRIHYTNLSPGEYELKVRIENEGSIYKEISLPIKIYPPFYASTWAFIFYILLIGTFIFYLINFFNSRHLLMLTLEYEKLEKARIESLNQAKVKFYINVSHEFRTPISLIMAQIELLLNNNPDLNTSLKKAIDRIYKNTFKLQNLVLEVLDFNNQKSDKMILDLSTVNVVELITDIVDSFQESAVLHNQEIKYISSEKEIYLYIDRNQFSKVINNLISNACKFTPKLGKVTVSSEQFDGKVTISISDTGIGIPAEDLPNVFERFYQASNASYSNGSGIGLSYVKEIVEVHGGNISVINKEDDSGCVFTIELDQKKSMRYILENQDQNPNNENTDIIGYSQLNLNEEDTKAGIGAISLIKKNTILIVEDNVEMLNLLAEIFTPIYNVQIAKEGSEALSMLNLTPPDIVLSDVMMTTMSGLELCAQIKNNYETCHIPVVLLTAQSLEASTIEGLQSGADDYITKPFNAKLLVMRCNNLVNMRHVLQDKFAKQAEFSPKIIATNPNDILFMEKAYKIIEDNFDNQNFDVNLFCTEMAMSRVKLYSKMKVISGLTPKDFIQNVKLKKAAELLVNRQDLLISDITYKLGFSSPRHFSKSFKELFGIIPSKYRDINKQDF